jgi:hypothetical protein
MIRLVLFFWGKNQPKIFPDHIQVLRGWINFFSVLVLLLGKKGRYLHSQSRRTAPEGGKKREKWGLEESGRNLSQG